MKKLVIALFLILILVGVLFVGGCAKTQKENNETNNINNESNIGSEPTEEPQQNNSQNTIIYKTSDKLSEITFTRDVSSQEVSQQASFKLTGYLQEIDPQSSSLVMYGDKAYTLKDGALEWELQESYNYGSLTETIASSGKDEISNLNVYWDNGNPTPLTNGDYDIKLKYTEHGFNEQGKSELEIVGKLLIPINENINGETKKQSATVSFPINFLDHDITQKSFSNSFVAREGYENEWQGTIISGYQNAIFAQMKMVVTTDIPVLGNMGPWQVSWDLEFP
jgi:hypothetical protein